MANSSSAVNPAASSGSIRFFPRRDAMLGLYGLAMIVVIAGILLVMVPTILAPGRARWLLVPGVVLLVAGMATALLGQLTMMGKRLNLEFDAQDFRIAPILGRSQSGRWTQVKAVAADSTKQGQIILALADGRSLGLATRWLHADPGEIEREMGKRLDAANGYRTLAETFSDNAAVRPEPEEKS